MLTFSDRFGCNLDKAIVTLILLKIFLLEFLGISSVVNMLILFLIAIRVLFSNWRIPKPFLLTVSLLTMYLILNYTAGDIVYGNASYNLNALLTPIMYLVYLAALRQLNPKLVSLDSDKCVALFNTIYGLNFAAMLIQISKPYSLMAAAPATGQIPFYDDLISGFFMYASTHAVAVFSVFVVILDLNWIARSSGGKRVLAIIATALVVVSALFVSSENDNKAVFALLPVAIFSYYLLGLSSPSFDRVLKGIALILLAFFGTTVVYMNDSTFAGYINDNVLSLIDLAESSASAGVNSVGSGERIAIIGYALALPSTWGFGTGLGAAMFHEAYYQGFQHFGQADFGSLSILLGVWFLLLLVAFYIMCIANDRNGRRRWVLVLSIGIVVAVCLIYTQCFTRTNNAFCMILVCLALADRWEHVSQNFDIEANIIKGDE